MDSIYKSSIVNNSNDTIKVVIFYDRRILDSIYQCKETNYNTHLKWEINKANLAYHEFDSIKLTAEYKLPPKSTLVIEDGMNGVPEYVILNEILINKNNTLEVYKKQMIKNLFKKKEKGVWEFEIK